MKLFKPKVTKYKKIKTGSLKKSTRKSAKLNFGNVGLQSIESGYVSSNQLKAIYQYLIKNLKRKGKFWINLIADIPVTSKPLEVRMGKGKGKVSFWVARVAAGKIIIEITSYKLNIKNLVEYLKQVNYKLSIKTKIIKYH